RRDPPRARRPPGSEGPHAGRGAALRRGLPPSARHHPPPGQALLAGRGEVHRVPARRMSRIGRRAIPVVLLCAVAACRAPAPERTTGSCTHVQATRELRGQPLCEDVWTCARPPGGPLDRVGLHRLAPCEPEPGPVVLYLPGMHMNGELPFREPERDLRIYLAADGVRTWGFDYRTHAVPPAASERDLRVLEGWDAKLFTDDVAWALGFVRGVD